MMDNYNLQNIPAEKFQFAQKNDLYHDSKFETKPVTYFQGAFRRFSKNKGAVVGGIVIAILVLFAIAIPVAMATTKKGDRRGPLLQVSFRSNFALLGVALSSLFLEWFLVLPIPQTDPLLACLYGGVLTGAGLGTAATQKFIKDMNLYHAKAPFVHAHNFFLQVWIEAGLLGFVGFVASMLWNIKKAAHTVRHCGPSAARTITCAAASAMCGAMVCGLADYLWNYPRVMCIFWFIFAMALAGTKVCVAQKNGQ